MSAPTYIIVPTYKLAFNGQMLDEYQVVNLGTFIDNVVFTGTEKECNSYVAKVTSVFKQLHEDQ